MPALTVQPIVENAIKHGVRIRNDGIVRVNTQSKEKYYEIVISDNGIGFDTTQQSDSETGHIGIKNVEERLHKMCHGTLSVESKPGESTTVTLHIPL